MDLIKITPDKEKARSILRMAELIEERIINQSRAKMAALIVADYYEVLKELITAMLLIDGYKTLSHKDLIEYLDAKYKEFDSHEIAIMDDLRILRNRISYEGFFVETSYLERNEDLLKSLVKKLKVMIRGRLSD
jgi:hypothetical protein